MVAWQGSTSGSWAAVLTPQHGPSSVSSASGPATLTMPDSVGALSSAAAGGLGGPATLAMPDSATMGDLDQLLGGVGNGPSSLSLTSPTRLANGNLGFGFGFGGDDALKLE